MLKTCLGVSYLWFEPMNDCLFKICFPNIFLHYPKLLIKKSFLPNAGKTLECKYPCYDWVIASWVFIQRKTTFAQFWVIYLGLEALIYLFSAWHTLSGKSTCARCTMQFWQTRFLVHFVWHLHIYSWCIMRGELALHQLTSNAQIAGSSTLFC